MPERFILNKHNTIQHFLIMLYGAYRCICLLFTAGLLFGASKGEFFTFNYNLCFLLYFICSTVIYLISVKKTFPLIFLSIIDYFAAFLYGYFGSHVLFIEFIWIPGILTSLSLILNFPANMIIVAIMGIPGTILLSNGFFTMVELEVFNRQIPLSIMTLMFYIPISMLAIGLGIIRFQIEKMKKRADNIETVKVQLDKINRTITEKMFSLRNESTKEERKRISKEIHDTAGYVFINLIMMLQAASAVLYKNTEKAGKIIEEARDYAGRGINEIRHILREIRNYNRISLSLQNELFDTGISFQNATGVQVSIDFGNWPKTFSQKIDSFFISFMQEALTNSLKHGNATSISVLCWISSSTITMSISDNGRGATFPIKKGIGISAIEDFLYSIQGKIKIKSDAYGFEISILVPVNIHEEPDFE